MNKHTYNAVPRKPQDMKAVDWAVYTAIVDLSFSYGITAVSHEVLAKHAGVGRNTPTKTIPKLEHRWQLISTLRLYNNKFTRGKPQPFTLTMPIDYYAIWTTKNGGSKLNRTLENAKNIHALSNGFVPWQKVEGWIRGVYRLRGSMAGIMVPEPVEVTKVTKAKDFYTTGGNRFLPPRE